MRPFVWCEALSTKRARFEVILVQNISDNASVVQLWRLALLHAAGDNIAVTTYCARGKRCK